MPVPQGAATSPWGAQPYGVMIMPMPQVQQGGWGAQMYVPTIIIPDAAHAPWGAQPVPQSGQPAQ
jgi:hypothetical protein